MSNTTGVLIALLIAFLHKWQFSLTGEQPLKHFLHHSLQSWWAVQVMSLDCSLLGRRRVSFPMATLVILVFKLLAIAAGWDNPLACWWCCIVNCVVWAKFVLFSLPLCLGFILFCCRSDMTWKYYVSVLLLDWNAFSGYIPDGLFFNVLGMHRG